VNQEKKKGKLMSVQDRIGAMSLAPAAVTILLVMMIIVVRIFFRIFHLSMRGSYEVIELIAILVFSCSVVYAAAKGSKIVIDVVTAHFSPRWKITCEFIADVAGIAFWFLVAYATVWSSLAITWGEASMDLEIPVAPFQWFWALAVILNCIILIGDLVKTVTGEKPGDEKECV
jgi:TRAP-type C4-dicarboxylate transport system permease small subunit